MLSENIYTNSQKITLTILKHEGVPILWGEYHYVLIVQIIFFALGTHSWYVSHDVVGLWFDFVHVLLCSAAIRTITRNLLLSGQLQDETFLHSGQSLFLLKAVSGFVPENISLPIMNTFSDPKRFTQVALPHRQRKFFPLLLSQQWTIFSSFDTDTWKSDLIWQSY